MIFTLRRFKRELILLHLMAATLGAQTTPMITGIGSGFGTEKPNANAITAGTPTPSGTESDLLLFIHGSFSGDPEITTVKWNETTLCGPAIEVFCMFPSENILVANVPQNLGLYNSPGQATIKVSETAECEEEGGCTTSDQITYTVNPVLARIGTLPSGTVGVPYSTQFFTGGTPPYTFSASPPGLSTSPNSTTISGTPVQAGTFNVPNITDLWGNQLNVVSPLTPNESITFTLPTLHITSTGLPNGTEGQSYGATVSATGGTLPYSWSATGLPSGLGINSATGFISGIPFQPGTFTVTIRVSDASMQMTQAALSVFIATPPPPPLQITTPSLQNGAVGQVYASVIAASGGTGNYTFTVVGGSLPPGINLALSGTIFGTPKTAGTYSFTVQVNDGQNTISRGFSITIGPGVLTVSGSPPATVQVNSPISVPFSASGGVPPYKFSLSGNAPTGTSLSGSTLSGAATAPGVFNFVITATDSESPAASASLGFSITVTAAPITVSANLPAGTVGQTYTGQLTATGGTGSFTWSGSAGDGLSVSSTGAVTGTPTTTGTVAVSATATDSSGATGAGSFSIMITVPALTVTTSSLPNGALTASYSASLSATGGTPPYTWSATGLPDGLSISSSTGAITGTPTSVGTFTVNVAVTDSNKTTVKAGVNLTITSAPLRITTTGISPASLGQSFSVGFGATGGTAPYTWSATSLPGGITITTDGTLSGTPTATGTFPVTVAVKDSASQTASENLTLTVGLPPSPTVNLNGFPTNGTSGSQVTSPVTLGSSYPVDVTVKLTLTFTPANGADDPTIQFATGGRTTTVTVKAGSTSSTTNVAVQTGTVAGTITITEQVIAADGTDITPSPAPTRTIVIPAGAPTITSVTAATSSTGLTVTVIGFDPTRSITQATFTFTPVSGSNIQTATITVPAQSLFGAWYQSAPSAQYGSQFSFTMPFTVTGNVSGIASVAVTLTNLTGTSPGVTGTL